MPREIRTEVTIQAPAERVWAILIDFPSYPSWNPFVREILGDPVPGSRLTVRLSQGGSSVTTFHPRVKAARPNQELRWLGRLGIPGLFDGEHSFTIAPAPSGGVSFSQCESFRGLLVPLVWRTLDRKTRAMFERMNEAIRARCEHPPG